MGEELSFSTILRNEPKPKSVENTVAAKSETQTTPEKKEVVKEPIEVKAKAAEKEASPKPKSEERPLEKTQEKTVASPTTEKEPSRFTLQVGSFQSKKEAMSLEAELKKEGYKAFTKTIKLGDKGTWYRVRFGQYQDYDKALADKASFEKAKNIIAYVTRVRK